MFTNVLYEYVKDYWDIFIKHPFVDGIGSGDLDQEKFRFYLIQDYHYLLHYAKIYSLGVAKSNEQEVMMKFSKLAESILSTEMEIHRGYLKRMEISMEEVKKTKMSLANISYTHYMLAISYAGGVTEIAVLLLSCLWSYEIIAKSLYRKYGLQNKNEFYANWIKGYISDEYHELTVWLLDLINKLALNLTDVERKKLIEIFVNTTIYEGLFWDMAYKGEM